MNQYRYSANNRAGIRVNGVISAVDPAAAVCTLQKINLQPLALTERRLQSPSVRWFSHAGGRRRLAIAFTAQLASLMHSGLPLAAALQALTRVQHAQVAALASQLHGAVEQGTRFTAAIAALNLLSPGAERAMAVAEKSGSLADGLAAVAERLQAQEHLRRRVWQACLYPLLLIVVLGGLMGYLMIAVVPQLLQFSVALDQGIPRTAELLLGFADHTAQWLPPVLGLLCLCLLIGTSLGKRYSTVGLVLDRSVLRLPLVGTLSLSFWRARFFSELQSLTDAGVDLLEALDLLASSTSNRVLQLGIVVMRQEVEDGNRLSDAMRCAGLFDSQALQRIALGELTGDYSAALSTQADVCQRVAQQGLQQLEARVAPVLLGLSGLLVLWIIIAVIAPIYSAAISAGALI